MPQQPKRVMIIGLDAPIPERLYDYAAKGELPSFQRVIASGVWGKNGMNPLPTVTPPNWTALGTGAWPSTAGITCIQIHKPGDPLDITYLGFDSGMIKAEYLWTAIEKAGKRSIVLNWPTSWPAKLKNGWQVAGAGISPNEVSDGYRTQAQRKINLASPMLISNRQLPSGMKYDFQPVPPGKAWPGAPAGQPALEMEAPLQFRGSPHKLAPVTWQILALNTAGKGYDRVIVSESRDAGKPVASLAVNEWSPVISREFQTDAGPKSAVFRVKLVELSPDAGKFRLFITAICALEGYTYPPSLAAELAELGELPHPTPEMRRLYQMGWYDAETFVELSHMHSDWEAAVACYLLETKPWDLFAMHNHVMDMNYHGMSNFMDPLYSDAETVKKYQALELELYKGIDRMVGRILKYADEDTLVVFVSDHGSKPTGQDFEVNACLEQAGLVKFKPVDEPDQAKRARLEHAMRADLGMRRNHGDPSFVDWSQTKAYGQRSVHAYVNLKGRDPDGIVDPADYEKVQEEIIDALYSYKDPKTGRRPVVFALKKEDARFTGHWGPLVGDVVYAIASDFQEQHAFHLPTARHGIGSLRALFCMAGPGVKKGVVLERNVWSMDVVPTICYLTGWPVPADTEGAVVYQALEEA